MLRDFLILLIGLGLGLMVGQVRYLLALRRLEAKIEQAVAVADPPATSEGPRYSYDPKVRRSVRRY